MKKTLFRLLGLIGISLMVLGAAVATRNVVINAVTNNVLTPINNITVTNLTVQGTTTLNGNITINNTNSSSTFSNLTVTGTLKFIMRPVTPAVDMLIPLGLLTTNNHFQFLAPANLETNQLTAVMYVTNTTAAVKDITAVGGYRVFGTANVTNLTQVTITAIQAFTTNLICFPIF